MPLPEGVSIMNLASMGIIGLGALLHTIGLATPEWSVLALHANGIGQTETRGLWKQCFANNFFEKCDTYTGGSYTGGSYTGGSYTGGFYTGGSSTLDALTGSVRACQAFAILGLLASFLGLAMATISVLLPMMGKPKNVMFPAISLAGCVASSLCILITVAVWSALVHVPIIYNIGYSFILTIIAGILISVGGGLVHVANKRAP